jgi:hypothetical protein
MERGINLDSVRAERAAALRHSEDEGVVLLGRLLSDPDLEAGALLDKRVRSHCVVLNETPELVRFLRDQIKRANAGEELTVSQAQLLGAFASDVAVAATRELREGSVVSQMKAAVAANTTVMPQATVVVMPAELAHLGAGEERGSYVPEARAIALAPPPSRRTLVHELVHATQPAPQSGPYARVLLTEGVTDALTCEVDAAFSEEPSYPAQIAAVRALGDELGWERLDWLRHLNGSAAPEVVLGKALPESPGASTAIGVFFDAEQAAQAGDLDGRVEAARSAIQGRLSAMRP